MTTGGRRNGRKGFTGIAVAFAVAWSWTGAIGCAQSATDATASRSKAVARRDSTYVDGVYTDTGWYGGQPSSIGVTVTLAAGVVTAVRVTPHATVPQSLELQRAFAAAVPAVVVSKRLDEVNVGRLAGSSGTPRGFNDAIRKIRERARRKPGAAQ
jgi:uncharacterized protein with FMN-binding domain